MGLNPGLGRSLGEGNGYPFQYSGVENSMNCIVHGVAKSQTERLPLYSMVYSRKCYIRDNGQIWLFAVVFSLISLMDHHLAQNLSQYVNNLGGEG